MDRHAAHRHPIVLDSERGIQAGRRCRLHTASDQTQRGRIRTGQAADGTHGAGRQGIGTLGQHFERPQRRGCRPRQRHRFQPARAINLHRWRTAPIVTLDGVASGDKRWIEVRSSKDAALAQKAKDRAFQIANYRYDAIFRPLDQMLVPKDTKTRADAGVARGGRGAFDQIGPLAPGPVAPAP